MIGSSAAPRVQGSSVTDLLKGLHAALIRFATAIVSGPHWRLKALLAVAGLAYFMSFPSVDVIRESWSYDATWKAVERQIAHPLTPANYLPNTHESKLALRLTAPVILHVFGARHRGALVLQALSSVALLWFTLTIVFRSSHDRVLALFAAAGIATTFPGIAGISHDYRGIFDGVAYAFVAAAIWAPAPWIAFVAVVLAGFSDERALLSSILVVLWRLLPAEDEQSRRTTPFVIAIALAWAAYAAIRIWLFSAYGLSTPVGTGSGTGLRMIAKQFNGLPFGIWTALETLWVPVIAAFAVLVAARRQLLAASLALTVAAILLAASAVSDFTRSAAYVFPAYFVALKALQTHERRDRVGAIVLASSVLAVLTPTYYTGLSEIRWFFPAPVQILRMALS